MRFIDSGFEDIYHCFHSRENCSNDFSTPRNPGSLFNSEILSQFDDDNQALNKINVFI